MPPLPSMCVCPAGPLCVWLTAEQTLLCAHESAERLPHQVRVTVAASPPTAKLFQDMIALNLMPVHVYGLVRLPPPLSPSRGVASY